MTRLFGCKFLRSNGTTAAGTPTAVGNEAWCEQGTTSQSLQLIYKSLIVDIDMVAADSTTISRRLLLDIQTEVNVMADDIRRRLNIKMEPYCGNVIQLPSGRDVKPIGSIIVSWKVLGTEETYTTKFLVIQKSYFDVMLGRPSIEKSGLGNEDSEIAEWIHDKYEYGLL
jgi:hypothetical protein